MINDKNKSGNSSQNKSIRSQKIIVTVVVVALIITASIFAVINKNNTEKMLAGMESEFFEIIAEGKTYKVDMALINEIGTDEIDAIYKKSGMPASETVFSGVSFKSLLEELDIKYENMKSAVFYAIDGYASAISIEEATDSEQTFIVIKQEGRLLGNSTDGGKGPFMMILAKDQFSQRWTKFLIKVEIQ